MLLLINFYTYKPKKVSVWCMLTYSFISNSIILKTWNLWLFESLKVLGLALSHVKNVNTVEEPNSHTHI